MAKLHEVLAVRGQLKGQAESTRTDLGATFKSKRHLFEEKTVTFRPSEEGAESKREEQKDLQSTVMKELNWIAGIVSKYIDVSYQIECGNTSARADIILEDGTVILKGVPTTALLELEKRSGEIQDLIKAVPTLDPAKGFSIDINRGSGDIFKARDVTKTRTKKVIQPLVLYPATVQHPAQTKEISVDIEVGTLLEQEWSGLITPAAKASMLERAEELTRAITQARQRANEVEVPAAMEVGKKLFNYVIGS